jgi:hypothetical protein
LKDAYQIGNKISKIANSFSQKPRLLHSTINKDRSDLIDIMKSVPVKPYEGTGKLVFVKRKLVM